MQHLEIFPRADPEFPGLTLVLLRVTQLHAVHWRTMRMMPGVALGDMAREAERFILERFPGETSYRLALPMEDCGDTADLC